MLQIIIIHEPNSLYISEVRDLEEMDSLAIFDEEKKSIDLSSLENHIGETILVTHFNRNNGCTELEFEHKQTLTKVDTDENGFMFLEYN